MTSNEKLAIGIDIGGTKTNFAVIDKKGTIKELKKVKTNSQNPVAIQKSLIDNISLLMKKYNHIKGIGIASAGRVIFEDKIIGYATDNLKDWTDYPLVEKLKNKFKLPVFIDNDVNAALLAEIKLNSTIKEKYNNIVFLTIGTGLGGALSFNGKIVRGNTGSTGEFGHMILYPGGKPCNCGKNGCAEQYISGKAFKKRLKENLVSFDKNDLEDETIQNEITNDNVIYKKTLNQMTEDLTLLLENLKNSFDFDLCILGGSFSVYSEIILKIINKEFEKYNHKYYKDPTFIFSKMENKAGVIGAGMLVFDSM